MKLPGCCKDDMADRMEKGAAKGKAMMGALAAHKRGDHDADGDGDADGSKAGDPDSDGD